jgi:hypothetical protein
MLAGELLNSLIRLKVCYKEEKGGKTKARPKSPKTKKRPAQLNPDQKGSLLQPYSKELPHL